MGCATSVEGGASHGGEVAGRQFWVDAYTSQLSALRKHQKSILQLSNSFASVLHLQPHLANVSTSPLTTAAAPPLKPQQAYKSSKDLIDEFSESVEQSLDRLAAVGSKKERKQLAHIWQLYCGPICDHLSDEQLQDIIYDSLSALLPDDVEAALRAEVQTLTRNKINIVLHSHAEENSLRQQPATTTAASSASPTTHTHAHVHAATPTHLQAAPHTTPSEDRTSGPASPSPSPSPSSTAALTQPHTLTHTQHTTASSDAAVAARAATYEPGAALLAPTTVPAASSSQQQQDHDKDKDKENEKEKEKELTVVSPIYTPPDLLRPYFQTPNSSLLYLFVDACLEETKQFVVDLRRKKLSTSTLPAHEIAFIDDVLQQEKQCVYETMAYWIVTFRVLHKEIASAIMHKLKEASPSTGIVTKNTFLTFFPEAAKDTLGMDFYASMEGPAA